MGSADRQGGQKLRLNPRKSWYRNLVEVATNGDHEVTFDLARPHPAFVAPLASGFSVVYPCHVAPADMWQNPIGTGPFKFVEFKPNERVTLTKNEDYWKPGRPYLDGIELRSEDRPMIETKGAQTPAEDPRNRDLLIWLNGRLVPRRRGAGLYLRCRFRPRRRCVGGYPADPRSASAGRGTSAAAL